MDERKQPRGCSKPTSTQTTKEIRECRYCKARFEVDPRFGWKQFCTPSHQKLYWRYGSLSIGKKAARIERDMRKLIAAELAGLAARVAKLESVIERGGGATA